MEKNHMKNRLAVTTALLLSVVAPAFADTAAPSPPPTTLSGRGGMFPMQGGEAIYKGVCQGCHMPDAKGAVGAGMYPALAKNENLETAGYPVGVVVKGQKAMPPLGPYFSDKQVADVVNYVRTHFGNSYKDKVKPEDVKLIR
jgi:mono/diheme cytochrome c family protein